MLEQTLEQKVQRIYGPASVVATVVEYFLIERVSRPIMAWLAQAVRPEVSLFHRVATAREIFWMAAGMILPAPRLIRTTVGVQLAWLFTFVSLMPMVMLGTSVYLKTSGGRRRA